MSNKEKRTAKRLIRRASILVCLQSLHEMAEQLVARCDEDEDSVLLGPASRITQAIKDVERDIDGWRLEYQTLLE